MYVGSFYGVKTLLSVILLGSAQRALGAPLTFHFEGSVSFIHDFLELDESVYVGAPFSGGYTFDPTGVSDFYPNDPNVGSYYFGHVGRMWAQIGDYEFVTSDLGILIWNDVLGEDIYEPVSRTSFFEGGYQWAGMAVLLSDDFGNALDSDVLPLGVPDLTDFPTYRSLLIELPGDSVGIGGTLTSLTPEPTSVVLYVLGALLLASRRSCYRRNRINGSCTTAPEPAVSLTRVQDRAADGSGEKWEERGHETAVRLFLCSYRLGGRSSGLQAGTGGPFEILFRGLR